jgi:hypothetical protein
MFSMFLYIWDFCFEGKQLEEDDQSKRQSCLYAQVTNLEFATNSSGDNPIKAFWSSKMKLFLYSLMACYLILDQFNLIK